MLKPGTKIRFTKNQIAPAYMEFPERVDALVGDEGKIVDAERPGNHELFWVDSTRRRAFLAHRNDFEVVTAKPSRIS